MLVYILKRLLLMVPTLLGVLLITFAVVQFVPGGPVEQYLAEAKAGAAGGAGAEGGGFSYRGAQGVDPKRIEQIKALYGFDKPAHERFFMMLGQFDRQAAAYHAVYLLVLEDLEQLQAFVAPSCFVYPDIA